mgnify:FL=1
MPTDGGQRRRGADGLEDAGVGADDFDGRRVGFAGSDTCAYKVGEDGGFRRTCTACHLAYFVERAPIERHLCTLIANGARCSAGRPSIR